MILKSLWSLSVHKLYESLHIDKMNRQEYDKTRLIEAMIKFHRQKYRFPGNIF